MKIQKIVLFAFCFLFLSMFMLVGCDEVESENDVADISSIYMDFLDGAERFDFNGEILLLSDFINKYSNSNDELYYSIYDMNNDGVSELNIKSPYFYLIVSYNGRALKLFHVFESSYYSPLNNGAVLYMRVGGAPDNVRYKYIELDDFGNVSNEVDFSTYKIDNENSVYYYNDVEVSKEKWEELTEKIFNIKSDKVIWNRLV